VRVGEPVLGTGRPEGLPHSPPIERAVFQT